MKKKKTKTKPKQPLNLQEKNKSYLKVFKCQVEKREGDMKVQRRWEQTNIHDYDELRARLGCKTDCCWPQVLVQNAAGLCKPRCAWKLVRCFSKLRELNSFTIEGKLQAPKYWQLNMLSFPVSLPPLNIKFTVVMFGFRCNGMLLWLSAMLKE